MAIFCSRVLGGFGLALLLASCGKPAAEVKIPTLIIGKASDIATIDPAVTVMANDFAPLDLAYERLLRFGVKDGMPTGVLKGELASSWEVGDGGLSWLFILAPGHHFDDGSPVTAAAVKFSFERTLTLGLGAAQALAGLQSVEVLDDHRVKFHLAQPSPIFPFILALSPMVVMNPQVMAHQVGQDFAKAWLSENTAGSGPYRVVGWQRGQRLLMKANPYAFNRPRYFQKIVFKVIKDDATRRTELKLGDIDIYEGVTPDVVEKLTGVPGVKVIEQSTPYIIGLAMNTGRPPLSDVRVRQAIALGVDAGAIAASVVRGKASLMHGVLPPGVPGYDPGIPVIERNIARAKALLAEASVAPGYKLSLSYVPTSSVAEATVLALQNQLRDIGLNVSLEALAPSAMAKVLRGDFDMALGSWFADFPDPWPILQFAYNSAGIGQGVNLSRYHNPKVDRLLDQASITLDQAARIKLYSQAQALIVADQPMVNLFAIDGLLAYRTDIGGLQYNFWQPDIYNVAAMYRLPAGH